MVTCPGCGNVTDVPSKFCPRCGQPLKAAPPLSGPGGDVGVTNADTQVSIAGQPLNSALRAAASRQGQDTEFGQGELEATSAAQQALGAVGLGQRRAPTPEGGRVIQIGGPETHFKVEKIEVTRSDDTYCPYCGDFVYKDKTHRCPRCGRYPFCPKDYDESRKLCAFCLDDEVRASTVRCSLCGQQVSTANTFECPKCHRVAGKDHLHAATGNCQPCAEEYERFVTSLRRGEPVVAGPDGKLFTPDDADKGTLVAERGALRTAEGEQVAKLKDQMWYSPQWYKLRQRRFQEEKDAMKSFYPQMALVTTPQGEAYWKGQLTTRLGKTYTIEMHYPSAFPYLPPKVYVTYPPIKKSRHIYEDGHLCLFHPDDKAWEASTTAATIVSWVAKWLHCYEVWQATGEWPGHERDQVVVTVRA